MNLYIIVNFLYNFYMSRIFRLYIDESGDHTYKKIEDINQRYLSLTGCIIDSEVYRKQIQPEFELLKQKHFPHSPDDP